MLLNVMFATEADAEEIMRFLPGAGISGRSQVSKVDRHGAAEVENTRLRRAMSGLTLDKLISATVPRKLPTEIGFAMNTSQPLLRIFCSSPFIAKAAIATSGVERTSSLPSTTW
jgi:hypothetical protein